MKIISSTVTSNAIYFIGIIQRNSFGKISATSHVIPHTMAEVQVGKTKEIVTVFFYSEFSLAPKLLLLLFDKMCNSLF